MKHDPHRVDSHATLDFQYALFVNAQRTRIRVRCALTNSAY